MGHTGGGGAGRRRCGARTERARAGDAVRAWSAPTRFYSSTPQIVLDNMGSGQWLDFWIICDTVNCHMYSSDDNGQLYRAQTTVATFPNGFSTPIIAMQDTNKFWLFEGANVYRLGAANEYLLLVEAIGEGRRMFRSWKAPSASGPWTPLADTKENPFARHNNVTHTGTDWTNDYSDGEMIRSGIDQNIVERALVAGGAETDSQRPDKIQHTLSCCEARRAAVLRTRSVADFCKIVCAGSAADRVSRFVARHRSARVGRAPPARAARWCEVGVAAGSRRASRWKATTRRPRRASWPPASASH
ncbi:non-reducing end alpha-L-arabinofuranosidase family hydrolase [Phytohabitans sp. LJ34]|uniref:non-reducing end alpha-L-arabinofuranosidase family hydrolase n=1 Tax=Phytohabitans sp. LJ34 TaxID=3452217 RepID=UPI003F8C501B